MTDEAPTADRVCHCSRCNGPRDRPGQRLCRACKRKTDREWRAKRTKLVRAIKESGLVIDENSSARNG